MEQNLGNLGKVDESYAKGVANASVTFALPTNSFGLSVKANIEADLDAKTLVAFLAAKIGGPIPAEVASFIEAALAIT